MVVFLFFAAFFFSYVNGIIFLLFGILKWNFDFEKMIIWNCDFEKKGFWKSLVFFLKNIFFKIIFLLDEIIFFGQVFFYDLGYQSDPYELTPPPPCFQMLRNKGGLVAILPRSQNFPPAGGKISPKNLIFERFRAN